MHIIQSIEFKTSAKGKAYAKAVIDGKEVTIFGDFYNFANLKAGDQVEGDIVKGAPYNGKDSYVLNKKVAAPAWATKGPSGAVKAAEITKRSVESSLDRKEESFKVSATFRDATVLTQVWASKTNVPFLSDVDIQNKWIEMRAWLLKHYDVDLSAPPF